MWSWKFHKRISFWVVKQEMAMEFPVSKFILLLFAYMCRVAVMGQNKQIYFKTQQ